MKANGYDFTKLSTTDEGKALIDDTSASTLGDKFDAYLTDKCGIVRPSTDTTPDDTTPVDSSASGDTSVDTIVDLGEGDAAINKLLDYLELGGITLSSDQRSCLVSELSGKVTGAELNQAIAGNPSDELTQTLGLALIGCKVDVQP